MYSERPGFLWQCSLSLLLPDSPIPVSHAFLVLLQALAGPRPRAVVAAGAVAGLAAGCGGGAGAERRQHHPPLCRKPLRRDGYSLGGAAAADTKGGVQGLEYTPENLVSLRGWCSLHSAEPEFVWFRFACMPGRLTVMHAPLHFCHRKHYFSFSKARSSAKQSHET